MYLWFENNLDVSEHKNTNLCQSIKIYIKLINIINGIIYKILIVITIILSFYMRLRNISPKNNLWIIFGHCM